MLASHVDSACGQLAVLKRPDDGADASFEQADTRPRLLLWSVALGASIGDGGSSGSYGDGAAAQTRADLKPVGNVESVWNRPPDGSCGVCCIQLL